MTPAEIRSLRDSLSLTQAAFAERYHLDKRTLEDWEYGRRKPNLAAQTYLTLIRAHPKWVARALAALKKG